MYPRFLHPAWKIQLKEEREKKKGINNDNKKRNKEKKEQIPKENCKRRRPEQKDGRWTRWFMTMIAQQWRPRQFLPHHPPPGEGSRFMLTIDKVHQRRVWDSGNFETPPASPILPSLSLIHVGSSVTCDCVTSITRGTGEWIKQIGSRRRA